MLTRILSESTGLPEAAKQIAAKKRAADVQQEQPND